MPRTEESNQRIRDEQQRRIVQVATRVFARKGLAATKMAEIATEAQVGYGILYHYFLNKEVLFRATVERGTRALERLIETMNEQGGSPWERISHLTEIILTGIRAQPESFLVVQQVFMSDAVPSEIRELALQQSRQGMALFHQLILEGQATGQIADVNAGVLAQLYFACIEGIASSVASVGIPDESYPTPEALLRLLKK
jgi:AcrR family transcriptional regulator